MAGDVGQLTHRRAARVPGDRARAGEVDAVVAAWATRHDLDEAMAVFERAEVVAAPVYDVAALVADEQMRASEVFVTVPHDWLGTVRVQAPVPRFSAARGRVEHLGPALGAHNDEVYGGLLGLTTGEIAQLRGKGVI